MKTPSFRFGSIIIFLFLFASFFHLQVYANGIDDSAPDPIIEVTGVDFDFGSVFNGTQLSEPRQFVIRNIGQETLIFNVTVTNPDFMYSSGASSTLLPGESVISYLIFKPSTVGVISGTLTITSNDPVNSVLNFNMTGVGLTSPVEETFIQDTVIELTNTIRPFKITNTSDARTGFRLEPFFGNFVQFPIDTYVLDPGESVWAELKFTGFNNVGIQEAVFQLSHLSIHGNALDPIFITVELVTLETPWGPLAYVTGASNWDFGKAFVGATVGPLVFEIINPSPTPLICHLSSSDPNFWIDGPDTTFIVTRDDFFSSSYSFKPLTAGDFSGEIILTTNDPNHPTFLWNVHGEGMGAPFQLVEDTIQVGEQSIQTVTIQNTASIPLEFTLNPDHNDEHDSFLELVITPNVIALAPGETATFQVEVDATDFIPGVYYGSIGVDTWQYDRFKVPFVLTIVDLPQDIGLPDSIIVEVPVGTTQSSSFVIHNSGDTELDYVIDMDSSLNKTGTRHYSTGFEEFPIGPLQFQGGWYSADYIFFQDEQRWTVEEDNEFAGSKHLHGISGGGYGSDFYSPVSPIVPDKISIVEMMVNFKPGAAWRIAALELFLGTGNVLIISPDGSLSVVENYGTEDDAIPISDTVPEGYFKLKFAVNNDTQEFSIGINDLTIFTGTTYVEEYRQISLGIGVEESGSSLDIDNIRFIDGDENISFISVAPSIGSIPPYSSETINLLIDTRNIDTDVYTKTIHVSRNDTSLSEVSIPVIVTVKENELPVLTGVFDATMEAGETLPLTFSASDVDDSLVTVTDFYVFSTNYWFYDLKTSSGNGYVNYDYITVETAIDNYFTGMILARDVRGGIVSKFLTIHVLAHNKNDFSLTNFRTNVEVENFVDTVLVDIARPDIDKITVQFKPATQFKNSSEEEFDIDMGLPVDVQFILDGKQINVDRSNPYYLNSWEVPKLSQGYHTLTAIARYDNEWFRGVSTRRTIIHVINSTAVTSYQVVNRDGVKLMDLVDGSIIDLSLTGSNGFNIEANVTLPSIRSVKFVLNDVTARIDNGAPYALAGNPISGDTFWKPKPGQYTLTATPYMKYFGWGPKGNSLTINFQVIKGAIPAAARIASSSDTQQVEEIVDQENVLSVYPVPVADELHIELHESVKGKVVVNIMSAQGKSIHSHTGEAEEFRKYSVSTEGLGMSSGIYFVIVSQANGKRVAKKFIKD